MKQIAEYLWIICFVVSTCGKSDALPICNEGPLYQFIAAQSDISMTFDSPAQAGPVGSEFREKRPKRSDPCETSNYRIVEDPNVRIAFLELWEASGADQPMDQRSEQGAWIVLTENNDYDIIPFPEDWSASPCGIDIPDGFLDSIPPGVVGIVHTHPFYKGDDTTAPAVCGQEGSQNYQSGGNNNDLEFLLQVANHLSDYCIKGYIIDGNHIISMTTWRELAFYPTSTIFRNLADDFNPN